MKLHTALRPLACVALAATAMASGPTTAQESNTTLRLPPVEVSGKRAAEFREDVQRACPDYREALKSSLARHIRHIDRASDMQVVFQLKGNHVERVEAQGGPYELRQPVRRAVANFSCVNDGQQHQQYSFLLVFKNADGIEVNSPMSAMRRGDAMVAKRD